MRLQHPLGLAANGQSVELQAEKLLWNFEELLTDLYDLSGMPECWQRFLARICTDLHASVGVIVRRGSGHEGDELLAAHTQDAPSPEQLREACEKRTRNGNGGGHDTHATPIVPATSNGKSGHSVFMLDLEAANSTCPLRALGVRYVMYAQYACAGQTSVCLAVGRMSEQSTFDETEASRFAKIAPYFDWAVQLADLFAKMTANVKASTAVLDLLPTGVVILDEQGSCVSMNRAAREALDPDGSALRFLRRNMLKNGGADSTGAADPAAGPQVLSLPGHAPGQRSVAVLWDIPDDKPEQQRKLAFIMDPDHARNTEIDVAALERIYGLTMTEARVAALVAENNSVAEIAERMGSTAHTVRTHLRHIFEKTGTERQVDLVYRLLQSPLALRLPQKRGNAKSPSNAAPEKPSVARN